MVWHDGDGFEFYSMGGTSLLFPQEVISPVQSVILVIVPPDLFYEKKPDCQTDKRVEHCINPP